MEPVSTKKNMIILSILILLVSLSCNHPDVYRMVDDYFFGKDKTREARDMQLEGTENARSSTQWAGEQTKNAEANNRLATQIAIQDTQNALNRTQTGIAANSTYAARVIEANNTNTAVAIKNTIYAQTMGADPRNPVIDSVRFPVVIYTGEAATGQIVFHDYNGDVRRVRIDAVKAIGWSPLEFTPDNRIISGDRFSGTIEFSFT